jgi:hypothetical protein
LKVKNQRDSLILAIRTHLLPVITGQGFRAVPQAQRGPIDRESVLSFPFGQLGISRGGE